VIDSSTDTATSKTSISPFSADQCQQHLSFLKHLKGVSSGYIVYKIYIVKSGLGGVGGYAACIVGESTLRIREFNHLIASQDA
jgi:hypothetical protein